MRMSARVGSLTACLALLSLPLGAQTRAGALGEMAADLGEVEQKIVGLAKAMPEAAYGWRPGPGARTTSEVLMHVAADNYFLPAAMGIAAPAETGVTGDYKTAMAFEKKTLPRDQVITEVEKSFAFLKKALAGVPDARIDETQQLFGQKRSVRAAWLLTTVHLHEHLGQLIAHARGNKVTPPWSK